MGFRSVLSAFNIADNDTQIHDDILMDSRASVHVFHYKRLILENLAPREETDAKMRWRTRPNTRMGMGQQGSKEKSRYIRMLFDEPAKLNDQSSAYQHHFV